MFEMSYNKAILIQRCQFYWYRRNLGYRGYKMMRKRTSSCPPNVHPDEKIPVRIINELVPRGGFFETFRIRNRYRDDSMDLAVYSAMERGLI